MNVRCLGWLAGFLIGLGLIGCASVQPNSSAAPPPLPPGGGAPFVSDGEAAAARELYIAKCTACHKFHSPANYDAAKWNSWMTKMSKKAKLQSSQEELLRRYLNAYRTPFSTNSAAGKGFSEAARGISVSVRVLAN